MTPQQWLDHLRQSKAEKMASSGARTKEIAYQLGYKQPSHFCRQFKQSHGLPLKAWKKESAIRA
jgi:AraC-like DNA-binding protein